MPQWPRVDSMSVEPNLFLDGLFQNPPIADLGHPSGAGEMAFPAAPRARRIGGGLALRDAPRNLGPVGGFPVCVEQAQISHEMLFVVGRNVGAGRGFIIDIGVQFRLDTHRFVSLLLGMVSAVRPRKPSLSPW